MKRNISIRLVVAAFVLVLFSPGLASAHEEVGDEHSERSLTVHIEPNEKPVAGEESVITYFITDEYPAKPFTAQLTINGIEHQHFSELTPEISDTSITARYTFPEEGSYKIELKVAQESSEEAVFSETVQVSAAPNVTSEEVAEKGMSNTTKGAIVGANLVLLGAIGYALSRKQKKNKK
jgi:hypothetical protein